VQAPLPSEDHYIAQDNCKNRQPDPTRPNGATLSIPLAVESPSHGMGTTPVKRHARKSNSYLIQ
jgi:hypothetical protein